MLLSLFVNISATISRIGADSSVAIVGVSIEDSPISGESRTVMPRAVSNFVNSEAAAKAGFAGLSGEPETDPSFIISAPSGPASTLLIPSPQLGTYLSRS